MQLLILVEGMSQLVHGLVGRRDRTLRAEDQPPARFPALPGMAQWPETAAQFATPFLHFTHTESRAGSRRKNQLLFPPLLRFLRSCPEDDEVPQDVFVNQRAPGPKQECHWLSEQLNCTSPSLARQNHRVNAGGALWHHPQDQGTCSLRVREKPNGLLGNRQGTADRTPVLQVSALPGTALLLHSRGQRCPHSSTGTRPLLSH